MLVIFYPSYSALPRKQSGLADLTCFLPCISFTRPYECPFKFTFNYEHRKMLDRDQCCRVAVWNQWSSVSHKKLLGREYCVCRSVVMVKKPDVFPPKFCHLSCTANRFQKTKCHFMQKVMSHARYFEKNHQCLLALIQIIVST